MDGRLVVIFLTILLIQIVSHAYGHVQAYPERELVSDSPSTDHDYVVPSKRIFDRLGISPLAFGWPNRSRQRFFAADGTRLWKRSARTARSFEVDLGYLTGGYVIRKRPDEPQFEVSVDDGELIPGDVRIYNARKIARLLRKKHPPHMRFG